MSGFKQIHLVNKINTRPRSSLIERNRTKSTLPRDLSKTRRGETKNKEHQNANYKNKNSDLNPKGQREVRASLPTRITSSQDPVTQTAR